MVGGDLGEHGVIAQLRVMARVEDETDYVIIRRRPTMEMNVRVTRATLRYNVAMKEYALVSYYTLTNVEFPNLVVIRKMFFVLNLKI